MENGDIQERIIDLGAKRKGQLNETILSAMGTWVKDILGGIFGGARPPVSIRGNRSEIQAFTNAIAREKSYMTAYNRYGLSDPKTYNSKAALNRAVDGFTQKTGIPWPFK